jgi:hypothetical protein
MNVIRNRCEVGILSGAANVDVASAVTTSRRRELPVVAVVTLLTVCLFATISGFQFGLPPNSNTGIAVASQPCASRVMETLPNSEDEDGVSARIVRTGRVHSSSIQYLVHWHRNPNLAATVAVDVVTIAVAMQLPPF